MIATTTPPTRWTPFWTSVRAEPSRPAAAPSPAKTREKPSTNRSVAGTARAGSRASTASPAMIPR